MYKKGYNRGRHDLPALEQSELGCSDEEYAEYLQGWQAGYEEYLFVLGEYIV